MTKWDSVGTGIGYIFLLIYSTSKSESAARLYRWYHESHNIGEVFMIV